MPHVKVMIHAVWATKNRTPFLKAETRCQLIPHIIENARSKLISIDSIDGFDDHLHCLFALNADMSVSKAMQLIKGESAHWINSRQLTSTKFEWAVDYYAVAVGASDIDRVRVYIRGQELHHRSESFEDEYRSLIRDRTE